MGFGDGVERNNSYDGKGSEATQAQSQFAVAGAGKSCGSSTRRGKKDRDREPISKKKKRPLWPHDLANPKGGKERKGAAYSVYACPLTPGAMPTMSEEESIAAGTHPERGVRSGRDLHGGLLPNGGGEARRPGRAGRMVNKGLSGGWGSDE